MGIHADDFDVVKLPATLTIRNIRDIHDIIRVALEKSSHVMLDVPSDAVIDISFIQLVESARVSALTSSKIIQLSTPAAGPLLQVLSDGGFIANASSEGAQFWLQGKTLQ